MVHPEILGQTVKLLNTGYYAWKTFFFIILTEQNTTVLN